MARLYADRDGSALEPHFSRHVDAMTAEGLHGKAAIAAELAYRDAEVDRLRADAARRRELEALLTTCCDELNEVGNASFWKLWPTSTPMGDVQAMIRAARAAIDAAMESERQVG